MFQSGITTLVLSLPLQVRSVCIIGHQELSAIKGNISVADTNIVLSYLILFGGGEKKTSRDKKYSNGKMEILRHNTTLY